MKKIVYAAIGFALLTGTAFADAKKADAKKDAQKKATFEEMDTDDDAAVTRTEFTNFWKQRFKKLDKNGDGVLDKKEWTHAAFKIADSNKDGKTDPAEYEALHNQYFKTLDQNKDEYLTLDEYLK